MFVLLYETIIVIPLTVIVDFIPPKVLYIYSAKYFAPATLGWVSSGIILYREYVASRFAKMLWYPLITLHPWTTPT